VTFSVVARCADTGMFGVAVSSSSPAVAARCAYARAGVGAVASQNVTDPTLGPRGLDLMALGASAPEAVAVLKATGAHIDYRQITAVDAAGRTAIHSGPNALGIWAEAQAPNGPRTSPAAAICWPIPACRRPWSTRSRRRAAHLGDRLIAVMQARAEGGQADRDGPRTTSGGRFGAAPLALYGAKT
jgi:hypothetical protein